MAGAAYLNTVKLTGTAVPVTGEACSFVSGSDPNKVYQVTSSSRRIWDPSAAITVKDGGGAVSAALWSFDYLFGIVTFIGHSVSGAITVDGSYLPTIAIAEVRKYALKLSGEQLDKTTFDDANGWRSFMQGLKTGSVDAELLSLITATLDTTHSLLDYLTNDTPKVLEIGFLSKFFRLWCKPETLAQAAEVGGLVVTNMTWRQSANGGAAASYGS